MADFLKPLPQDVNCKNGLSEDLWILAQERLKIIRSEISEKEGVPIQREFGFHKRSALSGMWENLAK